MIPVSWPGSRGFIATAGAVLENWRYQNLITDPSCSEKLLELGYMVLHGATWCYVKHIF